MVSSSLGATVDSSLGDALEVIVGDLENVIVSIRGLGHMYEQTSFPDCHVHDDAQAQMENKKRPFHGASSSSILSTMSMGRKLAEPSTPDHGAQADVKRPKKAATISKPRSPMPTLTSANCTTATIVNTVGPMLDNVRQKPCTPRAPQQPIHHAENEPDIPIVVSKTASALSSSELVGGGPCLRNAWADVDEMVLNDYIEKLKSERPSYFGSPSPVLEMSYGKFGWIRGKNHPLQRSSTASLSSLSLGSRFCRSWVVSPVSTQRFLWDLASIVFLLDDVIIVPLNTFESLRSTTISVVGYICTGFWMVDMVMSARTSFYNGFVLELQAIVVATNYLKTWFCVDLFLVTIQWLHLLKDVHPFFSAIQLFRLLRLFRLSQLRRSVLERSNSNHVHLYLDSVRVAVFFVVAMHLITCGWYWVGFHVDGWIREDHMQGADLLYSYFAACRWTIAQVSGRTDLDARTTEEYMYTTVACVFGLIIMSVLISTITNTMIELGSMNRDRQNKLLALNSYLKSNQVSVESTLHAKTSVLAKEKSVINVRVQRETEVMRILPRQIAADILFEIREPFLSAHQLFFDFGQELPRMLRSVCADAVKTIIAQEDECLFATGDACTRVLFVTFGLLHYMWQKRAQRSGDRKSTRRSVNMAAPGTPGAAKLMEGDPIKERKWLSEAALWMEWENRGELKACDPSSLLSLDVEAFVAVTKQFRDARSRSVFYAKVFIEKLRASKKASDVTDAIRSYLVLDEHENVVQTTQSERSQTTPRSQSGISFLCQSPR